ncbi:MAG: polyprenyl synthetase family protein [Calothrix sp. SM1_5_4]|nr:polyprenyl synthetase family protein [Calothrix sp. SM1_5_4]
MSSVLGPRFPDGPDLENILNLSRSTYLEDLFARSLIDPVRDILLRPRKNVRGRLVNLGFRIAGAPAELVEPAVEALEFLHAGSLVVDDIQDGSRYRRGRPSLHDLYGMPVALNAGNWLYFLPFRRIENLGLSPERTLLVAREFQSTLLRAHYGQALDVGIPADTLAQGRLPEVSLAAIELKSGALSALSFKLGALIQDLPANASGALDEAGRRIGTALQMFDDLGNVSSKADPAKRCEDLRLRRLSFVCATAAEILDAADYQEFFRLLVGLPAAADEVFAFLSERGVLCAGRAKARAYLDEAIAALRAPYPWRRT